MKDDVNDANTNVAAAKQCNLTRVNGGMSAAEIVQCATGCVFCCGTCCGETVRKVTRSVDDHRRYGSHKVRFSRTAARSVKNECYVLRYGPP